MELTIKKPVAVQAKTLKICIKVRDEFAADLLDQDGAKLKAYEGYVPRFMPGDHFGDYLMLDIDIDTGQITNWEQPDRDDVEEFIAGESD
jgi:hypothetical protein